MKAKPGIHYRAVDSDLARESTGEVLSALNRREILQVLEANPIESIAIRRTGGKQVSGEYDWLRETIVINSARKMGIHYGAEFRPGIATACPPQLPARWTACDVPCFRKQHTT